mgnify:CR=1 FL=1
MKVILSVLLLFPLVLFSQEFLKLTEQGKSTEKIYEEVDQEATFPGGAVEMMKYLNKTIVYPETSMENGEQGKVFVEFVVNSNGSISEIKIIRGVSKRLDIEAIRVVTLMPNWSPAEVDGEKVRSYARLPINFVLSE